LKKLSGYLTMYLALTLGVLVTLCLALIEGIRLNTMQLEAVCIADIGVDSVMAEYHRELFRRFNLLAIDSSYGSGVAGRDKVRQRLEYYLTQNLIHPSEEVLGDASGLFFRDFLGIRLQEAEPEGLLFLTDGDGLVFRRQAIEALRDDMGITAIQEVAGWLETVREYQLDTRDVEAEKKEADEIIASYQGKEIETEGDGKEILDFEDPTVVVENRKKRGIFSLTLGDNELSGKRLNQSVLLLERKKAGKLLKGNLPLPEVSDTEKLTEKLEFSEYLMRYFGSFTDMAENSALDYELEYLIAGKDADADNLKGVLHRLLAMREAANATYLFSDKEKYGEADLAALAVSVVLLVPELQEVFRTAIILGWAYAESVYDLKVLLKGGRIPLIKTSKTWHYGLSGILADVWEELWDKEQSMQQQDGLTYEDYLRILILLTGEEDLTLRAMNLVESDVRQKEGNQLFRLDACIVALKCRISVASGYGYLLEWREEKKY